MKTIDIVGPRFFGYLEAISTKLMEMGIQANVHDERHSNSVFAKICYRLGIEYFIKRKKEDHLKTILQRIKSSKAKKVLLIDTEVINESFVQTVKSYGKSVYLYMWDSSKNKPNFLKLIPHLESVASFDHADCANYGFTYIPLFAEDCFKYNCEIKTIDVTYMGTMHSRRLDVLQELIKLREDQNIKIRFMLYYHSKILFLIKCITNPVWLKFINMISSKGYEKQEIALNYFKSHFVLDVHHPGQDGLTSRTFESLRAGCNLITFNPNALELEKLCSGRIHVIQRPSEIKSIVLRQKGSKVNSKPDSTMDEYLSIHRFCIELISHCGQNL